MTAFKALQTSFKEALKEDAHVNIISITLLMDLLEEDYNAYEGEGQL